MTEPVAANWPGPAVDRRTAHLVTIGNAQRSTADA